MDKNLLQYLPTFAELCDRYTVVLLKRIFITENKDAYDKELVAIENDMAVYIKQDDIKLTPTIIKALSMIMLSNRYIWENESLCRSTGNQNPSLLVKTHSVNGVRNRFKNVLSQELGQRIDMKIDCLAAELQGDVENWNV